MIAPIANGSNCLHWPASASQKPELMIALIDALGNSIGGVEISILPIPQAAAMLGAIVQGFVRKTPAKSAVLFNRQKNSNSAATIVCKPSSGEKAMKVPTAKASAVFSGGSSKLNRFLNARLNITCPINQSLIRLFIHLS